MEIVWHGHACFRLKSREITIIADPYDPKVVGLTLGKPTADIVTVSHDHRENNNVAAVGGEPKVIAGPGEYEIRGVFITGIQTFHDNEGGKKRGKNTVYLFDLDDVVVCHVGDLGHVPNSNQAEAMSKVDVLLVPVGSTAAITMAQASEIISLIEPKIVIPMPYRAAVDAGASDYIERFCRELGLKMPPPQAKLTVTRSSLPEESQVVLLEYRKA